jgi:hypothetical protein
MLTPKQFDLLARRHNKNETYKHKLTDIRIARLCCLLANIHRGSGQKPYKVEDFLPQKTSESKKVQTLEEQWAVVKMLNTAFGGTVV